MWSLLSMGSIMTRGIVESVPCMGGMKRNRSEVFKGGKIMNISGRFDRVSKSYYRDGKVLVGFCGNVYPHDLTEENIRHIKAMVCMPNGKHRFYATWPEDIEPAYPAAKKNFKNGFMLIEE